MQKAFLKRKAFFVSCLREASGLKKLDSCQRKCCIGFNA
jgi:hypothetical protein